MRRARYVVRCLPQLDLIQKIDNFKWIWLLRNLSTPAEQRGGTFSEHQTH